MRQYQSFPCVPGDSDTFEKLKLLRLPLLAGRTFLDVGCNEGFFCGFAAHDGATRSVGIDRSREFVTRARARFPQCEFLEQGWDRLPDGPFDVVLLASALHYADDQPALVHALMSRVSPGGTLVLEIGVARGPESKWVTVRRSIDERMFPTFAMVREVLKPYAWKHVGPSVAQPGDPVPRHVFHVRPRKPYAYLLMQPPAFGKSSIARELFEPAGIPVVSGDRTIGRIATGKLKVAEPLASILATDFSPHFIARAIARVFEAGQGDELIRALIREGGPNDFALDAYLPGAAQLIAERIAKEEGYFPVVLRWEAPDSMPGDPPSTQARANSFFEALAGSAPPELPAAAAPAPSDVRRRPDGYVDDVWVAEDGRIGVRGWALTRDGRAPQVIEVRLKDGARLFREFKTYKRPDVRRIYGLDDDRCGYELHLELPGSTVSAVVAQLELRGGEDAESLGEPFRVAARLTGRP